MPWERGVQQQTASLHSPISVEFPPKILHRSGLLLLMQFLFSYFLLLNCLVFSSQAAPHRVSFSACVQGIPLSRQLQHVPRGFPLSLQQLDLSAISANSFIFKHQLHQVWAISRASQARMSHFLSGNLNGLLNLRLAVFLP